MFDTEEKIRKKIITSCGEEEFQIRFIRDESVGILTSRSDKNYFILDSVDYWYDLIQEKYPAKQKCSCKNDLFEIYFDYMPRKGTDDYRAVELISQCAECGKQKKFAQVDIDYSPSSQLFEQPISFCKQPKIKYKTYSVSGYWKEEDLSGLLEFLSKKQLLIYCWFWDVINKKRYVKRFTFEELKSYIFVEKPRYLAIYFSAEPLEDVFCNALSDDSGIYIDRNLWRKREIIKIDAPIMVVAEGAGNLYYMEFCSEYIDAEGKIISKSEHFCHLTKELLSYSKDRLK